MKHLKTTVTVSLLSECSGAGAPAPDLSNRSSNTAPNPNKAQTAPSKDAVQQQQANPSNENMDANAQRAHSRASGSTKSSDGTKAAQANVGEVRDWRAIDKNHDNLIEPDEMQAELDRGKSHGTSSSSSSSSNTHSTGSPK